MSEMSMEDVEEFLTKVSGGASRVGTQEGRLMVAATFGYLDARFMVYMMETHGFPLTMSAMVANKRDLKVDFTGLRCELTKIGKKPSTIDSELAEMRHFAGA